MSQKVIEIIVGCGIGAALSLAYGWILKKLLQLEFELTKAEAENKNLSELAKSYLQRAHAAEEELEALKPVIDDWFFGPQRSPSSVPAIEAQSKQLAAELDMGDLL